eukprot:COSAG04_NODE_5689_length_1525_cov_10.870968_3_plen_213_part_01
MGGRQQLLLAAKLVAAAGRAAAPSVVFHPPALMQTNDLHGPDGTGAMSQFYSLDDTHLFGQADEVGAVGPGGARGPNPMPMYYSSDSGASWAKAGQAPAPIVAGSYEPIPGPAPHTLQNFGVLPYEWPSTPPPWRSFTSPNTTTFSVQERPWSVEEECSQCLYCWPSDGEAALVSETARRLRAQRSSLTSGGAAAAVAVRSQDAQDCAAVLQV